MKYRSASFPWRKSQGLAVSLVVHARGVVPSRSDTATQVNRWKTAYPSHSSSFASSFDMKFRNGPDRKSAFGLDSGAEPSFEDIFVPMSVIQLKVAEDQRCQKRRVVRQSEVHEENSGVRRPFYFTPPLRQARIFTSTLENEHIPVQLSLNRMLCLHPSGASARAGHLCLICELAAAGRPGFRQDACTCASSGSGSI